MSTAPPIPPRKSPKGLSAEARRLWNQTVIDYSFRTEAEFALLRQLVETYDRLRQIQREIDQNGLVTVGYKGQPRANPLLSAEDSARKMILALSRALKLTQDDDER